MSIKNLPEIIQGGMGVNISSPELAKMVSKLGQQGTISGTALEWVMVRSLQMGDPGEHFRRVLAGFPFPDMVKEIMNKFYVIGRYSQKILHLKGYHMLVLTLQIFSLRYSSVQILQLSDLQKRVTTIRSVSIILKRLHYLMYMLYTVQFWVVLV
jgi:NAD(P)H-dependent flavin oxidoreductase YrpB (nitropropane dioxygenase family)